jgi:hypothetical protein
MQYEVHTDSAFKQSITPININKKNLFFILYLSFQLCSWLSRSSNIWKEYHIEHE